MFNTFILSDDTEECFTTALTKYKKKKVEILKRCVFNFLILKQLKTIYYLNVEF